ncbi:gluconate 2-dehydrogenase subunit 3 family protein [Nocardioides sp.]|uniref:gluconate 2-dehydrogenase subunit 3 family protein n=1 Tax=Nocardioides sp. TaxID=35761 RepID=UPI003D1037E4
MTFQALRPEEADLFLSVIEAVLPHTQPELEFPRQASALVLDAQMVANLGLRQLVLDGLRELDQASMRAHRIGFSDLSTADRTAALREIEDTAFFQTLIHLVKSDFYNRHIVWKALGYPDLDREAGYLDHGFDQLPVIATIGSPADEVTHRG